MNFQLLEKALLAAIWVGNTFSGRSGRLLDRSDESATLRCLEAPKNGRDKAHSPIASALFLQEYFPETRRAAEE